MNQHDKEQRQLAARALDTLRLFKRTCTAIESTGQQPAAVFQRIIDTAAMTPQERARRVAELLRTARQRRDLAEALAEGKADDHA